MSEFSAFLAGLILGDNSPAPTKSNHTSLKSNIALQDVAFCQSLRNIIDGLEEYVSSEHPTPQEFIRHILPNENFEEPLTEDEEKTIASNQRYEKEYIAWITSELQSSGEQWEDLTATNMIWRDPAHTPDADNLDFLFGDPLLSTPVKCNGRVYEYNTTVPLSGLAKGFFESVPAKFILAASLQFCQNEVNRYGFKYDFTRFEFDAKADKNNALPEWKRRRRVQYYFYLLGHHPEYYSTPWSDYTKTACSATNSTANQSSDKTPRKYPKISRSERRRRTAERNKILKTLSPEEKTVFEQIFQSQISLKRLATPIIGIILCSVAVVVGFLLAQTDPNLGLTGIIGLILLSIGFTGNLLFVFWLLDDDTRYPYLKKIQNEYYYDSTSQIAKEYEKLLSRIQ